MCVLVLSISVEAQNASLSVPGSICIDESPFALTGGEPVSGIYSGLGVTGGVFHPAAADTGSHWIKYTILHSDGTSSVDSAMIIVYPIPVPEIISSDACLVELIQDRGTEVSYVVCEGGIASFFAATTNASYAWFATGGTIMGDGNSNTVSVHWTTAGSGLIKLIETNLGGCSDSVEVSVNICEKPVASFTGQNGCLGVPNDFIDQSTGAISWRWNFGDGTTSDGQNPTHTYSTPGSHTVTLIIEKECNSESGCMCTDTVNMVVDIESLPGPLITCASSVCADSSSVYSTDTGCTTYNWVVVGGSIISGQNTNEIDVDWGAGPEGTVTLDVSGCTPANCTRATAIKVPILPTSGIIIGNINVCAGSTHPYRLPLVTGTIYNWSIVPTSSGSILTGNGTNQVEVMWNNNGTGRLVVTMENPFLGCQGDAFLDVTTVPVFLAFGASPVCEGDNSTVIARPGAGGFTWSVVGGTVVSGQGTDTVTINWNMGPGIYDVIAKPNVAGAFCNDSVVTTVEVLASPPADSIAGPIVICPGLPYIYTAFTNTPGVLLEWTITNGTGTPSTGNPITVTWDPAGPYSISVTQKQLGWPNCESAPLVLTVDKLGAITPDIIGPDTLCAEEITEYSAEPVIPWAAYTWSVNPPGVGSIIWGQGTAFIKTLFTLPGSYTLDLSLDFCGSVITTSLPIIVHPTPTPIIAVSGNLCPGDSVGLNAGGVFSSYDWRNGNNVQLGGNQTIYVYTGGVYNLFITGSNGCTGKDNIIIQEDPGPKADITTADEKYYCTGQSINTILHALNGPGYTFVWKDGLGFTIGTGSSFTVTTPGTYYVIVTNAQGCSNNSNIITITIASCSGGPPICSPICATCPTPCPTSTDPVSFTINGLIIKDLGQTERIINSKPGKVQLNAPPPPLIVCNNATFVNTSAPGTVAWYWEFGDGTTSFLENPIHVYNKAGYYRVKLTVRFPNGSLGYVERSIVVPIAADFMYKENCGVVDFIDLSTFATSTTITSWSWDFGDATSSALQNPSHTYAATGTYTVILTISDGTCTSVYTKVVNIKTALNPQFTHTNACNTTDLFFTDGTMPDSMIFGWDWDFGDGGGSTMQNPVHHYVGPGTYNVALTITDIKGCTYAVSKSVAVVNPVILIPGPITASGPTDICNGQSVILTAPQGSSSYFWSNGATTASVSVNMSGIYTVTIISGGCQQNTLPIAVLVNELPNADIIGSTIICGTGWNSLRSLYFNRGNSGGYTFQWYKDGVLIPGAITTRYYTNSAGSFTLTITDTTAGCTATSSPIVTTVIPLPPLPTFTAAGPLTFCANDSVRITANAAGGPYTYIWYPSGETTASITVTTGGNHYAYIYNENSCRSYAKIEVIVNPMPDFSYLPTGCYNHCAPDTIPGPPGYPSYQWARNSVDVPAPDGIGQNLAVDTGGIYNLTIVTDEGCASTSSDLDLTLRNCACTNPPELMDTVITFPSCGNNTGTIGVLVTAGTGTTPLTYLWDTTPARTDSTITDLSAGTYKVTVTDIAGCQDSLTITITEPPVLVITYIATEVTCNAGNDGSINLTITGGTPGYSYAWDNGATTDNISGLTAGTYNATVTDSNGCTDVLMVAIVEPMAIALITTNIFSTCGNADGMASVASSGGTMPYTYGWSNGQTTAFIINLMAGTYTITVTDNNGCAVIDMVAITNQGGPELQVTTVVDVSCNGGTDGRIDITLTGGSGPFNYIWNNGATTEDLSGLDSRTFSITVTDSNGCPFDTTITINEPPALVLTDAVSMIGCDGGGDGSINITVTGGTPGYIFLWDNGATTEDLGSLGAGTYVVTVTDTNGCLEISSFTMFDPPVLSIWTSWTNLACYNLDGTGTVNAVGGTLPYTILWSNGATTNAMMNLEAGTYAVTVTDNNGCSLTDSIQINSTGVPVLFLDSTSHVLCNGGAGGSIDVSSAGGVPPHSYMWNNGATTEDVSGLMAGTYTLTITDSIGCTDTITATITEPSLLRVTNADSHVQCFGDATGSINVTATGGTVFYTYAWDNMATTEDIINLTAGSYTVTVMDANGCQQVVTTLITEPPVVITNTTATQPSCSNNDGQVIAVVTSGSPPYNYLWNDVAGQTTQSATGLYPGTYTVTVTDANGCADTSMAILVAPILPVACFTDSVFGCSPLITSFTSCSGPGVTCLWDFGDGQISFDCNPSYVYNDPGCYDVTLIVTDSSGCRDTLSRNCAVEVYPLPTANYYRDPLKINILNPVISFFDKSTNATSWHWIFENGATSIIPNPVHMFSDTGCFPVTLIVENEWACTDTTGGTVCIEDVSIIYVPNAFTPNGDGDNEWFKVEQHNFCEIEMFIFDRWGNLIYETTSLKGWDGTANGGSKIVQEDVYVWLVKAKDCYGKPWRRVGHVTVIR